MHWPLFLLLTRLLGSRNLATHTASATEHGLWPALLKLSSHNLVTTNLYWSLSRQPDCWQQIPSEHRDYLSAIFALNSDRNQTIINEASAIIQALNTSGITPLVLKNTGELLSGRTPHIGYRLQSDIDLLIEPHHLAAANTSVQALGYQAAQERWGNHEPQLHVIAAAEQSRLTREYKHHHHLAPLIKPHAAAAVELHRHAYGPRFAKRLPLEQLFAQSQLQQDDGLHYRLMSPAQRRHHLVYHSYISDGYAARHELPLRTACDWLQTGGPIPNEPQLVNFDALLTYLLDHTPRHKPPRQWYYLRLRHRYPLLGKVMAAWGITHLRYSNLRHNPALLRKRWRLWFN